MKIDRKLFFNNYPFLLADRQRDPLNFLLDKLETSVFQDLREWAYIFATVKRETADTFRPVIEGYWLKIDRVKKLYKYYETANIKALATIFPNGVNSPTYEGRGRVQTSHDYNYKKIGKILGIDLFNHPELALEDEADWKILELGFSQGIWTQKKLSDYINAETTDFINARKVVNGLDHAKEIAEDAEKYLSILKPVNGLHVHLDIPKRTEPYTEIENLPSDSSPES